ncbi:HAUS augmin-like complex subunit 1 isoform X2 [Passer domesticus]|uniref:HAUS augmin-like complex subunit 1 isoform X2 n=1 Tax=Passer domesticus TaxID=48849 RepID=UPI0030FF1936
MALAGTSDGDSFQEKLTRVTSWLKKLFNDAPIPQYEVNERTVDILHEIVECNEESDKDAMLVIEDMKDRTSKYEAEAEYWHDILRQTLGFFENSLFGEVTSDLVRSAMDLEVENTSLTSFYSVLNDMTLELYKTKSKNDELEHKLKILMKKLTSALMVEKQLEKDIEKVEASQKAEQAKAEIHSKNLKFLEDKSKDMKIRIADAENELVARGLDKSLTHEALMKSSEELAALRKKMEPLKMELASYLDLPPSILLAQVKVEEAKRELKVLDEELSREIEAVPFELL